ncbi:MAG TPA: RsmB/NOP family class I SAM-dependent RNA methyltransferase [Rubricoccaceae bacterium]
MPLPDAFLARLARIVAPDDLPGVLATFTDPLWTSFRVCTLLAPEADVLARLGGVPFEAVPGVPGAYAVRAEHRAALLASDVADEGLVYAQNASSQVPVHVLAPQPGERVLDLCAAPGSKTGQLAAVMQNAGEIVAVEKVRERFFRLRANVAGQGATCVRPRLGSGTAVAHTDPEAFDRVLLDAPCSTEGRFRTDTPATTAYWSPRKIKEMRAKQSRLLYAAVQATRPGGTLVYSTCTFAPEENEGALAKMLKTFGDRVEVVPVELPGDGPGGPPVRAGMAEWDGRAFPGAVRHARRVLPDGRFEAFFVARIVKHASTIRDAGR